MLKRSLLVITACLTLLCSPLSVSAEINGELIETVKKSVVSIRSEIFESIYSRPGNYNSTGFIFDHKNGIIVTNRHVASNAEIGIFYLTFFNGKRVRAKFYYSDPWYDFAFLKVDPAELPEGSLNLPLKTGNPIHNEQVLIVGNNNGDEFSIQVGRISNLYDSVGYFPVRSYGISLNTRGGSSGSPIVNESGEMIALNAAGSSTMAFAVPIEYINDAYQELIQNNLVKRQHNGMLLDYIPLDYCVQYFKFPKEKAQEFAEAFPDTKRKILVVNRSLPGTPAENILQPGDIIWSINGQQVGANMYAIDRMMNIMKNQHVEIEVFREGAFQKVKTGLYDLQDRSLDKFVRFSDIIFYEADDYVRLIVGAEEEGVYATNFYSKRGFSPRGNGAERSFNLIKINKMNGHKINTLEDLAKIIPELMQEQHYTVSYQNFSPREGYNGVTFVNREERFITADYNEYQDEPVVYRFDHDKKSWDKNKIIQP